MDVNQSGTSSYWGSWTPIYPHPSLLQHHERPPWLFLPLPAWVLVQGPSVPTGPHVPGQAALSIGAGRQGAGDRHKQLMA